MPAYAFSAKDEDRFWSKAARDPVGCWLFTGCLNSNGYGAFETSRNGKCICHVASRAAYQMTEGEPGSMQVCHTCDNRACVRPSHLFLGTNAENHADKARKGRAARGATNWNTKLSEPLVRQIRAEVVAGCGERGTIARVARRYGVSGSSVSSIVKRETWSYVEDNQKQ